LIYLFQDILSVFHHQVLLALILHQLLGGLLLGGNDVVLLVGLIVGHIVQIDLVDV
jgi:hypothetical protein